MMAAKALDGNNCGREGSFYISGYAADVISAWSGEVYPTEKNKA